MKGPSLLDPSQSSPYRQVILTHQIKLWNKQKLDRSHSHSAHSRTYEYHRLTNTKVENCVLWLYIYIEILPDRFVSAVKHPLNAIIWSVISGKNIRRLYVINGQEQYKNVFQRNYFLSYRNGSQIKNSFIFMQDEVFRHNAQSIRDFLQQENVPLLL